MMRERKPEPADPDAADIVVDCDLDQPPETVWRALTEPKLLGAWLLPIDLLAGAKADRAGQRFTLEDETAGQATRPIDCEVLAAEPPRLLRYSWRGRDGDRDGAGQVLDTVVTFTLDGTETGGTRLRVVHSGFGVRATALWTGRPALRRPVGRRLASRPQIKACAIGGGLRWAA